jgi:eukaryotic-like serine/threonine-protein kinase
VSANAKIAARYRVEGRLGVGGMSTVLLAFDERLERYVAVKLLADHLVDDPTFVSRFRREALAAARLVHPNIVQVFDFGLDRDTGQHFIVMERINGHSCAELLRDRGHLDVEHGVEIIAQACRGLDYAHRNGVVHRDVKPGNLLVSDAEVVKLADFGIARATDQSSITQVGSVLGTAAYLSPEQARGEEAGPSADLYSLGVVAYQLLSGRLPYEATSLSELALKQQRESPIPLTRLNPRVPVTLSDAVALSISIDPTQRPESAIEFGELIRDGAHGISPYQEETPTRHLTGGAATRLLPARDEPTAATRVATARPSRRSGPVTPARVARSGRPPQTTGRREPVAVSRREDIRPVVVNERRRSRGGAIARRLVWSLLLLGVVVAAIAIGVSFLVSTANHTIVHYRHIVANDAQQAIDQVRSIVHRYTK